MLTIAALAADLDAHVRYANSGKTAEQTAYQVNTINLALEEMRVACPQVFRATVPVVWTAASVTSQSVTNGSSTLNVGAPGCTIQFAGDLTYNERVMAANTNNLLYPYAGTTGTQTVTAWGDSVVLESAVDRVLGCIMLQDRRPLELLASRSEFELYQNRIYQRDYSGDYGLTTTFPPVFRTPAVPLACWVETVMEGNAIQCRAHCAPLPNGTYRASLDVQTMATEITANDLSVATSGVTVSGSLTPDVSGDYALLGTDADGKAFYCKSATPIAALQFTSGVWVLGQQHSDDVWTRNDTSPLGTYAPDIGGSAVGTPTVATSSATTRPVPGGRTYSILRALAMFHWSQSPWFRNDQARPIINESYKSAIEQLEGFRPNGVEPVRMVLTY